VIPGRKDIWVNDGRRDEEMEGEGKGDEIRDL
jgi:hypothetical protein